MSTNASGGGVASAGALRRLATVLSSPGCYSLQAFRSASVPLLLVVFVVADAEEVRDGAEVAELVGVRDAPDGVGRGRPQLDALVDVGLLDPGPHDPSP